MGRLAAVARVDGADGLDRGRRGRSAGHRTTISWPPPEPYGQRRFLLEPRGRSSATARVLLPQVPKWRSKTSCRRGACQGTPGGHPGEAEIRTLGDQVAWKTRFSAGGLPVPACSKSWTKPVQPVDLFEQIGEPDSGQHRVKPPGEGRGGPVFRRVGRLGAQGAFGETDLGRGLPAETVRQRHQTLVEERSSLPEPGLDV